MIIRKHKFSWALAFISLSLVATSCFEDDTKISDEYAEWRQQNLDYITKAEAETEGGKPYYSRIAPSWAPDAYTLIHWHNDTNVTRKNLKPMDNSTVGITYELFDIEGNRISDSFSNTDSLYRSMPSNNITGVWYALTSMHVGDSVTLVIPSEAGYGERSYGGIKPYSTLIYNIKLKNISAYEMP